MFATFAGPDEFNGLHAHFPEDLKAAFTRRARVVHARRDQIIISEGIDSTDVFLIMSGSVRISLLSRLGRETIMRDLGAGQIFGEMAALDGHPRSANVVACEDAVLTCLGGDAFVRFLSETPKAGLWMAQQLSRRVRDLTDRIFELTTMPVNARLYRELRRLAEASDGSGDQRLIARLPTHSEIAARIGTHREAVTRELGLLSAENILSQSGRRATIVSVAKLEALIARSGR